MKCSRCGNIMPNDAKYCDRCGEPLRKRSSRYEYDYDDDYDDDYEYELRRNIAHKESSKSGKFGSAILIFLTVVAVCVTVLLALNMYLPSKNKVDNTSNVANNQQQQQQVQNQPKQSVQQEEPDDSYDATGRDLSNYYYAVDYYSSNYNDSNAYLFPGSDSAYIDPEELSGCTDSQLAYIRNEIFARHGYIFKTDKYNNYFESKSWYHPNSYATDNVNDLNAYEKYNVELIKSLE